MDTTHTSWSKCNMKIKPKTRRGKTSNFKTKSNYSWVHNSFPLPLLINDLIFFRPGHSNSNLQPINYWKTFPNQIHVLKQYTYANFSFNLAKGMDSSVLCFALYVFVKMPTDCVLFWKLVWKSQLTSNYWPHFA